jgi:hypothetical protein
MVEAEDSSGDCGCDAVRIRVNCRIVPFKPSVTEARVPSAKMSTSRQQILWCVPKVMIEVNELAAMSMTSSEAVIVVERNTTVGVMPPARRVVLDSTQPAANTHFGRPSRRTTYLKPLGQKHSVEPRDG